MDQYKAPVRNKEQSFSEFVSEVRRASIPNIRPPKLDPFEEQITVKNDDELSKVTYEPPKPISRKQEKSVSGISGFGNYKFQPEP